MYTGEVTLHIYISLLHATATAAAAAYRRHVVLCCDFVRQLRDAHVDVVCSSSLSLALLQATLKVATNLRKSKNTKLNVKQAAC